MACHRSDGTGAAPQLTLHGNNRTEEPQVCIVCHNPNNTDIPFRQGTDPKALVGRYAYPEQSIDFKTLVHGIHASTTGFREKPLVVIAFNHTVFDASALDKSPGELTNCVTCHIDNRRKGTFELPLRPTSSVRRSTRRASAPAASSRSTRTRPTTSRSAPRPPSARRATTKVKESTTWSGPAERRSAQRRRTSTTEWSWSAVSGATVRARSCPSAGCTKSGSPSVPEGARARPSAESTAGSRGRPHATIMLDAIPTSRAAAIAAGPPAAEIAGYCFFSGISTTFT